jgi:phosphoserine phosphatase
MMSDLYPGIICSEGFFANDPESATDKLARFRTAAAAGRVMLATDADETLTEPGYSSFTELDSLAASYDADDEEAQAEAEKYARDNRRFVEEEQKAGVLTADRARAWWELSFNRYRQMGLHLPTALDRVSQYRLRPGVERLFTVAEASEMPTVVLSAGVKNIIERMLATHGINPTLVVANELYEDEEGRVIGWNQDVIHPVNKNVHAHGNGELKYLREEHPYAIVLGDSPHDGAIVSGDDEKILRILVNNPNLDAANLAWYLERFDLVARDAGMLCTAEAISWIGNSRSSSKSYPPIHKA